jgi:protein-arginine kinase activator protein McsA
MSKKKAVSLPLSGSVLCDDCHVEPAIIHLTPIATDETRSNGPRLTEMDVCEDCANISLKSGLYEWHPIESGDDEDQDDEDYVPMIASGYDWDCPKCERANHEIEYLEKVTCKECHATFSTNPPEHAYS